MYVFQPDRHLLAAQMRAAAPYVKGRVLDAGAGTVDRYSGGFTADEYVRMETQPGPGIDVVGSIYEIPFPDASFDTVVSTQVFEHLARPADAARELFRVLKEGGHAVVTAPQMNELHEEPHDYFRYTNFGLESLFKDAGFQVVTVDQRGGYYAMKAQLTIRHWIDAHRLYQRPFFGRVMGKLLGFYGKWMLWRDAHAKRTAHRKHAIGWMIVVRK